MSEDITRAPYFSPISITPVLTRMTQVKQARPIPLSRPNKWHHFTAEWHSTALFLCPKSRKKR